MIHIIPFFLQLKQFVTFVFETTIQNFLKTNRFLFKKLYYFFVYIFSFGIKKIICLYVWLFCYGNMYQLSVCLFLPHCKLSLIIIYLSYFIKILLNLLLLCFDNASSEKWHLVFYTESCKTRCSCHLDKKQINIFIIFYLTRSKLVKERWACYINNKS